MADDDDISTLGWLKRARDHFFTAADGEPDKYYSELALGMGQLCEAIARAIDPKTKAHAPLIFNAAQKRFWEIVFKNQKTRSDYFALGCVSLTGAMDTILTGQWPNFKW